MVDALLPVAAELQQALAEGKEGRTVKEQGGGSKRPGEMGWGRGRGGAERVGGGIGFVFGKLAGLSEGFGGGGGRETKAGRARGCTAAGGYGTTTRSGRR